MIGIDGERSRANLASSTPLMESGIVTMSGKAADMLNDPRVRAAYLGE